MVDGLGTRVGIDARTFPVGGVLRDRDGLDEDVIIANGRDGMILDRHLMSLHKHVHMYAR